MNCSSRTDIENRKKLYLATIKNLELAAVVVVVE
jgi:hypothetical protein